MNATKCVHIVLLSAVATVAQGQVLWKDAY